MIFHKGSNRTHSNSVRHFIRLGLFFFLIQGTLFAQYPQQVVKKLTSPEFDGRGYVNQGDRKAAAYIESEFRKTGLKPVNGSYTQPFAFPVNTFPGKMVVKLNGKALLPGADFIVDPSCPTVKGKFKVNRIGIPLPDFRARDYSNEFILIDTQGADSTGKATLDSLVKHVPDVRGIIVVDSVKLTWSVDNEVSYRIGLHILKGAVPESCTEIELDVQNKLIPEYVALNVMGYIPGKTMPDSFLVFTAHYDHLGRMGSKAIFPGANDNASGTAMLLDLARYYSQPENRLNRSVLFLAFAAEEAGLIGSHYYTSYPPLPLAQITFLVNLDLMGNGQEGITVVNGSVYPEAFALVDSINRAGQYVPTVGIRGKAMNSDHYWFTEKGVPAFFIYTMGGSKAYHDVNDVASNLTFEYYDRVKNLLTGFMHTLDQQH